MTVLFDDEDLQALSDRINSGIIGKINNEVDVDYIQHLKDQQMQLHDSTQDAMTRFMSSPIAPYVGFMGNALSNTPPGSVAEVGSYRPSTDVAVPYAPPAEGIFKSNKKNMRDVRNKAAHDLAMLSSGDEAMYTNLGSFMSRLSGQKLMNPEEVTAYAREQGMDIKVDKPMTRWEVERKMSIQKRKEYLEGVLMESTPYAGSSKWDNATLIAASIAGAVGPVELIASTAASWIAPELAVGALAGGANALQKGLKLKKTADILADIQRTQTMNKVLKGMSLAGNPEMGLSGLGVKAFGEAGAKVLKAQEKAYKAAQVLEDIGSATYNSMGVFGKFSTNAFAMTVSDLPWILGSRMASNHLETDTYSEQDMALDTLFAFAVGAGLPPIVHAIGSRFGLMPAELLNRRLTDIEKTVNFDEAMGRMRPEDAATARKAIADIRASQDATAELVKTPHPIQVEAAEQLAKVNTTSEQLMTWVESAYMLINAGKAPDISKFPQNESLLSHISAQVNRRLINESARDVYGEHLIVETGKHGTAQVHIDGETGLLGKRPVSALTQEDAEEMLRDMYKGFLMHDEESMARFMNKVDSYSYLKERLEDIYARDIENISINSKARKEGTSPKVSAQDQVNKPNELKEAYMAFMVGEENLKMYRFDNSGPLDAATYARVAQEAEEFANKWSASKKLKEGRIVTDFIDPETGKADGGKAFRKYLDEVAEVAENNEALASTYDTISKIGDEKLREMLETSLELGYPDTDLVNLMGAPRIDYPEFVDAGRRLEKSRSILSIKRMEYRKLNDSGDAVAAMRDLRGKDTGANKLIGSTKSLFSQYESLVKDLDRISKEGLKSSDGKPWVNVFGETLLEDEALQQHIADVVRDGLENAPAATTRHLKKAYKDAIRNAITKAEGGIADKIGSRRLSKLISDSADLFEREYKKDSAVLTSIMTKENLAENATVSRNNLGGIEINTPGRLSTAARNTANRHILLTMVQDQIEQALIDTELAALNEMDILVSTLALMKHNPAIAGEIITARATQSIYPLKGAQLSVEYQSMSVGAYLRGLELKLRDKSKNNVNDLWEIFKDKQGSNRNDVMEAITRKIYDENYQHPNSDIAIVSNEILDQASSFNDRFRRLGTDYKPFRGAPIDRSKLRYIDMVITDNDVERMNERFDSFLDADVGALIERAGKNEQDEYKLGNKYVAEADVKAQVAADIDEMKGALNTLKRLSNDAQQKTAYWAFRDLDLDAKFNVTGNSAMPLNIVRDAVLSGRLDELIESDLISVHDAASALKSIVRYLVGKPNVEAGHVHARGWVASARAAQSDLSAVTSGQVAASVARMEDTLPFKDADTAVLNVKALGYDSIEQMVQAEYHNSFQAYYALKEFGVSPVSTIKELHRVYNDMVQTDGPFRQHLVEQAMSVRDANDVDIDKFINTRYVITENAARSNIQNAIIACGLENQTPSAAATVIKAITGVFAAKLLPKAGLKSLADYSTIWSGLTLNGMAKGTGEAMAMTGKATAFMMKYPELAKLIASCSIIEQDTLLKAQFNNPALDGISASNAYGFVDKVTRFNRWYGNTLMNNLGQMERITNNNKRVAGLSIGMAIGLNKDVSYNELSKGLQKALLRDGLEASDWEFMRKHMVMDMGDAAELMIGSTNVPKGEMYIFTPLAMNYIPDSVLRSELKARGVKNINQEVVNMFREDMLTKTWTLMDANAQEMISIPSQRVQNWMHMGAARNSALGITAEVLTQFQSFGAALTYNTYIKYLSNFTNAETGITVMDLFNPKAKVAKAVRQEAFAAMLPVLASVGLTTTMVDTMVAALAGNLQRPVDEHGVHIDNLLSGMLGSLGTTGTVLNAGIEALGGSGQRGGGISVQVAPSVSEMTRIGYRLSKPLRSSRVSASDKPTAFAAATAEELIKFTGVPNLPIVALAYQGLIGAYLDSIAAGSPKEYQRQLKARERRGYVVFPWQRNPWQER